MVRQWDKNAIVVDSLLFDVDFQAEEGEDGGRLGILDIFHSCLAFHRCKDFIHDMFF